MIDLPSSLKRGDDDAAVEILGRLHARRRGCEPSDATIARCSMP